MPRSKEELIRSAKNHNEKARQLRKQVWEDTLKLLAKLHG